MGVITNADPCGLANNLAISGIPNAAVLPVPFLALARTAIEFNRCIQLAIIQLDIAILSVVFSELASIPTIYLLLKDKKFVKNNKKMTEEGKEYEVL